MDVAHISTKLSISTEQGYRAPMHEQVTLSNKDNTVAELETENGDIILVDEADLALVLSLAYSWSVSRSCHTAYASAYDIENKTIISMHRLLMGSPQGMHVHHINGNGLDNRRANLQVLTPAEHARCEHKNKPLLSPEERARRAERAAAAKVRAAKLGRGFARMDKKVRRRIARKAGRVAHARGHAHQYTVDEARAAGIKGGAASKAKRLAKLLAMQEAQS